MIPLFHPLNQPAKMNVATIHCDTMNRPHLIVAEVRGSHECTGLIV